MADEPHHSEPPPPSMPSPPSSTRRPRASGSRLQGCGCFVLLLGVIVGPFIAATLTQGAIHQVLLVGASIEVLLLLIAPFTIIMRSREGRGELRDNAIAAFLDGILGRFLG
jgi:hypothetical protein